MTLRDTLESKLRAALSPTALRIVDDSDSHAGHGASGAHVQLTIVADGFRGLSMVQRHRLIYQALAEEMKGAVHALAIDAKAPGE